MGLSNFPKTSAFEVNTDPVFRCRDCGTTCTRLEMSDYGCRCTRCYNVWCEQAPRYVPQKNYGTDPRGWARRILDKHAAGEQLSQISVRFAKEALGHDV